MNDLDPVREALSNPVEPPMEDAAAAGHDSGAGHRGDDGQSDGRKAMPEGCPVIPVGTENGVYHFISTLGELRSLPADKVANKHIVSMFAPDSDYLMEEWPRRKEVALKDEHGKILKDDAGNNLTEWVTTGWRNDEVAMLLMDVAATRGVWNAHEKVRGRGAWRGRDGGLIIHAGPQVLINGNWNKPGMFDDMVYPTAPAMLMPLNGNMQKMTAAKVCPKLLYSLRDKGAELADDCSPGLVMLELVRQWNWERSSDPLFVLGWFANAFMGGANHYRPPMWLTGDSKTGKSTLQRLIGWVFGPNGLLQTSEASEAAIRQLLGQQSLPVAVDEAEAEEDNRKMLALVKLARIAASAAGKIFRGGQDHQGHEFQVETCFLFSSILVPPIPPQDKNRLAVLEMGELPAGGREPAMEEAEINRIGQWMRRRVIEGWSRWPNVLSAYRDALIDFGKHNGRTADQFGALLAGAHLLLDDEMPDVETLMQWAQTLSLDTLAEAADSANESARCISHLGSSLVQLAGHGTPQLVSDWLLKATQIVPVNAFDDGYEEKRNEKRMAEATLAKIGIRIYVGSAKGKEYDENQIAKNKPMPGREYIAIANAHQGLARLFEVSRWNRGVWSQALGRVQGAIKHQTQRIGGQATKCTLVPVEEIIERDLVDEDEREAEEV